MVQIQRPTFGDALASAGITNTSNGGLDWSRVVQEANAQHAKLVGVPPLTNPCALAPCEVSPVHPLVVSQVHQPTDVSTEQKGFLISDDTYNRWARPLAVSGVMAFVVKPFWPCVAAGVTSNIGDNLVDTFLFKDVKRGKPSTYADIASLGVAFLPQSLPVRVAEMIGVHAVGKLIEKENS